MIVSISYMVIAACMAWTAGQTGYLLYKHRDTITDYTVQTSRTQAMMLGGLACTLLAQIFIPYSWLHIYLAVSVAAFWLIILTNIDQRLKRHIKDAG